MTRLPFHVIKRGRVFFGYGRRGSRYEPMWGLRRNHVEVSLWLGWIALAFQYRTPLRSCDLSSL